MPEKLKDIYFTSTFVKELSLELKRNYFSFDNKKFLSDVLNKEFEEAELKRRMRLISLSLGKYLPKKYSESLEILYKTAQKFNGFNCMVFPDFVECFGIDDMKNSFIAMKFFTPLCSSEFAIRPFIKKYHEESINYLLKLSKDKNHHIRRFSSEGCRPRLPWAMAIPDLKKNPQPILPILENLKNDSSEYVRKSVANNLNDISKDHPDLVLNIAKKWKGNSKETDWIIKHALRTLLKSGNKEALKIFGFDSQKNFILSSFNIKNKKIKIGEGTEFSFKINIQKKSFLRIEYAVYFQKKNGTKSRKIFQLTEKEFSVGEFVFNKKHSFKDLTTRKHHPGQHEIAIVINGEEKIKEKISLL